MLDKLNNGNVKQSIQGNTFDDGNSLLLYGFTQYFTIVISHVEIANWALEIQLMLDSIPRIINK